MKKTMILVIMIMIISTAVNAQFRPASYEKGMTQEKYESLKADLTAERDQAKKDGDTVLVKELNNRLLALYDARMDNTSAIGTHGTNSKVGNFIYDVALADNINNNSTSTGHSGCNGYAMNCLFLDNHYHINSQEQERERKTYSVTIINKKTGKEAMPSKDLGPRDIYWWNLPSGDYKAVWTSFATNEKKEVDIEYVKTIKTDLQGNKYIWRTRWVE
ncbi:MAG: hypothetical protein MUF50_00120 [Planctomycetes bacterium]|nr:hypothetical protein [Planctomycetota bacterium]